ncbi:MAG TPA: hypothetical protein VFZ79_16520 [Acidimicrobiales bacterium]
MEAAQSSALHARPATYAGLFVVTLTTLMYEIVLTRIFSVTMWYHFAFVAISVALFGMTVGALIVHLRPLWFTDDKVKRQMARCSLGFALAIAAAIVVQLSVPFVVELNAAAMFSVLLTCAVISVPFVLSGIVVCLALTRFPSRVNRLYAVDLVGAGLGCLVLVVTFEWFDGPSLVVVIGSLAAVAAVLFATDAGERRLRRRGAIAMVGLLVLGVGNAALQDRSHPLLKIVWSKEQKDGTYLHDEWNAFSRITVSGDMDAPFLPPGYGMSVNTPRDLVHSLGMRIDNTAGTWALGWSGDPDETDWLRYDITNLGYHAKDGTDFDSVVIGVGGGRDVLSALEFGARNVTGVEINRNMLDLINGPLGDFTGHLDQHPQIDLVNDEARSWLTRTDQQFDTIQISLIDTFAATSAGAFALSENSLYTTEAWHTYLDRLQPGGILSVSRWFRHETRDPLETFRTVALAAQVLHERGADNPRDHILIYEGPPISVGATTATVLVSAEPFDQGTIDTVAAAADDLAFRPVLTPDEASSPRWAALTAPGGPGPAVDDFTADISPPTDNRPFFFQMADIGTLLTRAAWSDDQVMRPVVTLAVLGLAVLLLAAVCIGGPLVHMGRRTSHRGRVPYYLYFSGIGLGFLMIEISQLQRLSTFLGHPTYALTVVLFTVLVFSGAGSMLVERLIDAGQPRRLLWPVVSLLVLLAAFGLVAPGVVDGMAGATTPTRIAVAVGLLAPVALLMGMPFSIGMRAAASDPSSPTAFLWGINGAMSVVASVFATVLALFFGITMTFLAGVAAYVLAGGALWRIVRALPASWTPAGRAVAGADDTAGLEPGESADATGAADGDGPGELVGAAEGGADA